MHIEPLTSSGFGALVPIDPTLNGARIAAFGEANAAALRDALHGANGLLILPGLVGLCRTPDALVRLSRLFGKEVEDYRETPMAQNHIHPGAGEVFVVSNAPPSNRQPPPRPTPPRLADGGLPVSFPHRRGWHTDQSYRRPPPDISLFLCVRPAPCDQAQTLYADGTRAYAALSDTVKARIADLEGLHAKPGTGRSETAIRAGETPPPLSPFEQPQRQPLVRRHPVTGRPALFLCEAGQMDWLEGPIVGLSPGPEGEGAALVYELMAHFTRPEFVHIQEWAEGDLVIYDNRCLIHAATWFEADRHERVMWRTTTRGNPGALYAGEAPNWRPAPANYD